jgi:zinc transporter, ZIP family
LATNSAGDVAKDAFAGKVSFVTGVTTVAALFGGLAIGLLGLVLYESRYMSSKKNTASLTRRKGFSFQHDPAARTDRIVGSKSSTELDRGSRQTGEVLLHEETAYRLAMMIAIGIGAHNFSEGLAIGQSYVSGAIGLAIILIIGFGAHNATEGFGIAGPLTGLINKPTVRFLVLAGLVGGGPTFLGTVLGSLWTSTITSVFFLSVAGGALIYVSMLMYNSGRRQTTNNILMLGIFVGLCAGFITDLIITLGGA